MTHLRRSLFLATVYVSIAAVAVPRSAAQEIDGGNIDALFGDSAENAGSDGAAAPSAQTPSAGGAKTIGQTPDEISEGNIDIDALFGGGDAAVAAKPAVSEPDEKPAAVSVKKKGIRLSSNYSFSMGTSPGWYETPWNGGYWEEFKKAEAAADRPKPNNFTNVPGVVMAASFGLNTQISDIFSVQAAFAFEFPDFAIGVDSFYFDYAAANKVFIRAGKWTSKWGISGIYPFTDLLARTPKPEAYAHPEDAGYTYESGKTADPYMARLDIPIGIGGFQLLAMTHDDFFIEKNAQSDLIGVGGKYNLAFRWADITVGTFYQKIMPLRTFLSVKSTIKNTEIYSELLNTVEHKTWDKPTLSVNLGLGRSFFSKKLTIGGEFFYNGEEDAFWVREADAKLGQKTKNSPFIEGVNLALSASYKPGWHSLTFFARCLYSIAENTGKLIPGFSVSAGEHVTARFAVPMALGSRGGTYYRNNDDTNNRPFSLVFVVTVGGSYSYGHYD